ncbi:Uncharacterised protein [Edwardsiella hoshinae]|uniref:Uncharacterized protein n=1 Tax=Edwardsiella hoshinae TaxID=93378 RepID=A0A376DB99_9GAMM|nr:Uncharacterised protein [Edwardsiella hoshinae]
MIPLFTIIYSVFYIRKAITSNYCAKYYLSVNNIVL